MKILFKSPEFNQSDTEANFNQAIEGVTAYKGLEKMDSHYLLELDNSLDVGTIKQLFTLFEQWHIDLSPLESFVQYVEMEAKKNAGTTH